ncbi:hypothetical protein [Streptomyces sp. NBC_01233]|uniref:hypothetical protein n=1 Tax=Streptomyces sp. NBC_01233 TaxID=2903787 RepID=UPI002E119614|nr:hypothetical protein OG332_14550 [Streptomyces sp. NBC_01233]
MNVDTTLIPALAITATAATSIYSLRHQQRTSEQARLWERQAALYVDLLANQRPYLAEPDVDPSVRHYFGPQTSEERALVQSLSARVDAFASEHVSRLWSTTVQRVFDVSFYISEVIGDPLHPTEREELEIAPLVEARNAASESLRKQIRLELKTDRPRGILRAAVAAVRMRR